MQAGSKREGGGRERRERGESWGGKEAKADKEHFIQNNIPARDCPPLPCPKEKGDGRKVAADVVVIVSCVPIKSLFPWIITYTYTYIYTMMTHMM